MLKRSIVVQVLSALLIHFPTVASELQSLVSNTQQPGDQAIHQLAVPSPTVSNQTQILAVDESVIDNQLLNYRRGTQRVVHGSMICFVNLWPAITPERSMILAAGGLGLCIEGACRWRKVNNEVATWNAADRQSFEQKKRERNRECGKDATGSIGGSTALFASLYRPVHPISIGIGTGGLVLADPAVTDKVLGYGKTCCSGVKWCAVKVASAFCCCRNQNSDEE